MFGSASQILRKPFSLASALEASSAALEISVASRPASASAASESYGSPAAISRSA